MMEESPESTALQWRGLAKLLATKTAARQENAELEEKYKKNKQIAVAGWGDGGWPRRKS